jgi:exopolysaccharide production protein ExoZ
MKGTMSNESFGNIEIDSILIGNPLRLNTVETIIHVRRSSATPNGQPLRPTRKYFTLEPARGLAALLVVLFHASSIAKVPFRFFGFGHAGVEFFFVLSGFLIYHAHARDIGSPARLRNYCLRRVIRIYPLYWALMALLIPVVLVFPSIAHAGKQHVSFIFKSFLLVPMREIPFLGVSWTLENELLFYALFALLIVSPRFWIVFAAWAVAIVCVWAPEPISDPHAGVLFGSFPLDLLFSFRNMGFLLGMGAAFLIGRGARVRAPGAIATFGVSLFLATGVMDTYFDQPLKLLIALYVTASLLVIFGLAARERAGNIKVARPFVMLGEASYALYLVHYPVCALIGKVVRPAIPGFLFMIFVSVAIAILIRVVFEAPLLEALRRVMIPRRNYPLACENPQDLEVLNQPGPISGRLASKAKLLNPMVPQAIPLLGVIQSKAGLQMHK